MPLTLVGQVASGKGLATERMLAKITNGVFKPLGMLPYPGTLNINMDQDPLSFFAGLPYVECGIGRKHYRGTFRGMPVWVLHFKQHAELMAEINLRETFSLRDGDVIEVELET